MENGTKLRLLYLYQHLVQHTDPEHTLSTAELTRILKEQYSLTVSRNTISNDLVMLHNCGMHMYQIQRSQRRREPRAAFMLPAAVHCVYSIDEGTVWARSGIFQSKVMSYIA